jgi:O-antigen/teichoic acid export membrane protein
MDLGVGNALANRVSYASAIGSIARIQRVVSGGLAFLFALGVLISLGLYLLLVFLPTEELIGRVVPGNEDEVFLSLKTLVSLFGLTVVAGGAHRVFGGLQRGHEAHLMSLVSSSIALLMIFIAADLQASIPVLLAITLGSQVFSGFCLFLILFQRKIFVFRMAIGSAILYRHYLIKVGGGFLALQIAWGIASGLDNLLVMITQGAGEAAVFSIAQRLFQFVTLPLMVMNAPLWAAYADASVRSDHKFILKTFKRSMKLTALLSFIGGGFFLLAGIPLANWWTGDVVRLSSDLLWMFFLLTIVESLSNALAVMLNGCGVILEQVITVTMLTVLALIVKPLVLTFWGVEEMLASYIFLYSVILIVMYCIVFRARLSACLGLTLKPFVLARRG